MDDIIYNSDKLQPINKNNDVVLNLNHVRTVFNNIYLAITNEKDIENVKKMYHDWINYINKLNCRLRKDNTTGINGIHYHKNGEGTCVFQWQENSKRKAKYFYINKKRTFEQAKQLAINFKITHDKITGNRNGYQI